METLQRLHNRGSISTGYDIDNSCKFEEDNLEALYAQPTADGNQRTWTVSMWFKRTELGVSGVYNTLITALVGAETGSLYITPTDEIIADVGLGGTRNRQQTAMKFRDTSAWYHIVWRVDTTQGTAADRHRLYVNGVLQEWTTIDGYPAQNFQSNWNNNYPIYIGNYSTYNNYGFNGYIAEVHHTDGVSNAPTEFGEFDDDSGIWKPKAYTGSYGAQGFYLPFDDSSNLGTNAKGNDVNFTLQNITSADQATDTPTNNFALISQAMQTATQVTYSVISEGGTKVRCTGADTWVTTVSSIGVTTGKWYAEFKITGARNNNMFGIASMEQLDVGHSHLGQSGGNWGIGFYQPNGNLYKQQNSGYSLTSGWGSSPSQNQTVGIAVDMDNHNLYIAINNTWQNSGDPTSGATGTGAISFDDTETVAIANTGYSLGSGNDTIVEGNFGGFSATSTGFTNTDADGYGTFAYAPPSGYYALCTKNLEEYG